MGFVSRECYRADQYRQATNYLRRVASRFRSLSIDDREELVFMTLGDATACALNGIERPMVYWRKVLLAYGGRVLERRRHEVSADIAIGEVGHVPHPVSRPHQLPSLLLSDAMRIINGMPAQTRDVMVLRAGGADAIEISDETGLDVVDVLDLIDAGRVRLELAGA